MSTFHDTGPIVDAATVTPADDSDLADIPRALWIGTAGNLSVVMADDKDGTGKPGATVTFFNIQAGTLLPIRVRRVRNSSTTADNILALY